MWGKPRSISSHLCAGVLLFLIMIKNMLKSTWLLTVDIAGVHRWLWKKITKWSFQPALWFSSAEEEECTDDDEKRYLNGAFSQYCGFHQLMKTSSSADENHCAGWKLQFFLFSLWKPLWWLKAPDYILFHRHLYTPAMSTNSCQVGVTLISFPLT